MLQNIFLIPKIKSDKREAIGTKLHDPVPECSGKPAQRCSHL